MLMLLIFGMIKFCSVSFSVDVDHPGLSLEEEWDELGDAGEDTTTIAT